MILRSSSGYCMPFEEPIKQDVQMSLGYGEQKNPVTGETFFHHGIDFSVNHYPCVRCARPSTIIRKASLPPSR